jgi:hypothetical protein
MEDREKAGTRYSRSRDYSRLLAMPEFLRLTDEVRAMQAATVASLSRFPDPDEHDRLTEIRYFNGLMALLEDAARQEAKLKEHLDVIGVKYT